MSEFTEKLTKHIKEKNYPVFSFAVSREGENIETVSVNGPLCCHDSYSIAKLFTVTAIGFLYDDGKIRTEGLKSCAVSAWILFCGKSFSNPSDSGKYHGACVPWGTR